jgi:hypothetical protein
MNNLLGVVVSIILFGFFILIVLALNQNIIKATYNSTFEKGSQQSIIELVDLLNFDFSKIGHQKLPPKFKPGSLDSTDIVWYSDIDNNGSLDSVTYTLGDIKESQLPNPEIRHLYRKINNNNPLQIGLGIVQFKLTYFDSSMTQINYSQLNNTAGVNRIRSIKVQVRVESQYKYEDDYSSTYWEKTYTPRSLRL